MILLLDIGNTRLKWGMATAGRIERDGAWFYIGEQLAAQLTAHWGELPEPERVLGVEVAGPVTRRLVSQWCESAWGKAPVWLDSTERAAGVRNGYTDPRQLGADRWAALIGARHHSQRPSCIVDCGTAITVDALDAHGQHQGGIILPGLALMRRSLEDGTGGVQARQTKCDGILGRDTSCGVMLGAYDGACGAVSRVIERLTGHWGSPPDSLFTGGDGEQLWRHCAIAGSTYVPSLVFHGLLAWDQAGA